MRLIEIETATGRETGFMTLKVRERERRVEAERGMTMTAVIEAEIVGERQNKSAIIRLLSTVQQHLGAFRCSIALLFCKELLGNLVF